VLPADTDPAKLREYAIKDNLPFGEDDWEVIASEWDTAELEEWGMSVPSEWKDTKKAKEDDFDPSQPVETVCKKGDIWQLGRHRLMCGDSTSKEDIAKLIVDERADMVFTDPPYGVSIGDKNKLLKEKVQGGRGNAVTDNIENDTLGPDELYNILVKAMTNVRESCKDDASYYVTSPQGGELGLMMMMMKDAGLTVRHMIIWCKNSPTFSLGRLDYDYQHEPILYTWTKSHHNYRGGEFRSTIWTYDKPRKCDLHPTMKPVALVANCMKDTTKDGDIILDVFGGSGTTLIAAEQLNRKCYMMELDPHYCDVIIARWEKLTGKKATKVK
jgi:DNA modification methylase